MTDDTSHLLRRWNEGDREALDRLLERHLRWIHDRVRRALGPQLRKRAESVDYVQDAIVELLRGSPRFHVSDGRRFRALVARIVINTLRDKVDWHTAQCRDVERELSLGSESVLELDPPADGDQETPSQCADRNEKEDWIRLGMELLEAEEREVLILRIWLGKTFVELGEINGESTRDAKRRFSRAMGRLTRIVQALRRGELERLLDEEGQNRSLR
jgi:RNA polymerase sigma factor (sigma-70 family)